MGLAEQANLVVELSLRDKLSRGILTANRNLKTLGLNTSKIGSQLSSGLSSTVRNVEHLGVVAATAAAGGLAYAVKSASDFEAELNKINTIAQVNNQALSTIGDGIRKVARDTGTPLEDLTQGYYDLLSAGVKAADAQGVLNAANTLAIGGLATTAQTVDLLTTAINSYGVSADKAADFADYFAQSIAAGKVTADELAASFSTVAPLAAASGIEIQELAAGYAQLTAKGNSAGESATQMRAAIIALQRPTKDLQALQDKLGINFADFAKKNGLAAAYQLIRTEAEKTGTPMIKFTGRVEGTNYALQVTNENAASYAENLRLVGEATDGAGVASEQAAQRQKGLAYQWGRLKALAKDVGITVGSELIPQLADLAQEAADFLGKPEQQAKIKQFAKDLADGVRQIVAGLKTVDWGAVANSLKTAAGFAGDLLKAFLGAPEWLKTAVLTGWGLNRLTGGALGGIVGELAKGLIKGILGINAAQVNLTAANVTMAGGGAGGVLGGGLSKASILKSLLGGGLIAGGLATQSGAFGQGPVQDIAGPLSTIAGAFLVGGPVVAALAAVAEAVNQGFIFMGQRDNAQSALDKQATAASQQTAGEALANLKNLNATLGNQGMWESLVTNTFGAAQTSKGLINLAASITENGKLSGAQVTDAIATLQTAQAVAIQRGWTDAAAAIGGRIDELKAGKQGQVSVVGPVQTTPTGATSVVPGPGFTEYMHAQVVAAEGTTAAVGDLKADFAKRWGDLSTQLRAQGEEGPKLRRDLAKGLGITIDELVQLRHVARNDIAATLGISVQEFIKARRTAHGDDVALAQKLGITVDELATIREKARATASNTAKIANKNFSPHVTVNNTFSARIGISGRTLVTTTQRQRIVTGGPGVE